MTNTYSIAKAYNLNKIIVIDDNNQNYFKKINSN